MATPEERARAMAVHSVSDEARVHGNADETELVFTGDGALRRVPPSDRGSRWPPSRPPDVS
jgi:hypothetical protein